MVKRQHRSDQSLSPLVKQQAGLRWLVPGPGAERGQSAQSSESHQPGDNRRELCKMGTLWGISILNDLVEKFKMKIIVLNRKLFAVMLNVPF